MKHQKNAFSTSAFRPKEMQINEIISKCELTKQQINRNKSTIIKQSKFQREGWKSVEYYLKTQPNEKTPDLSISQEIHKNIRKIYEYQINDKSRRLLKFIKYSKNQAITESDLAKQETSKFLSVNKREFGSPLKKISYFPKKNEHQRRTLGQTVDPEETVLMDIQEYRIKQSTSNGKILRKKVLREKESEGSLKEISFKNKIVYNEMKKICPLLKNSFGAKARASKFM